ncbi:MAG: autotransporter outer membrane beta-barrel domain-containing protein, partial [Actinobacteria bacterium]|nr:autotransporter outer membrane beta-barrel domain-containing protein [Actinomycetota bacterium]
TGSAGSRIGFNTYLGADNSPSNLLVINGGRASGTSSVLVNNTGGPGAQTVEDGIRLVQVIGGGTTTTDAFTLRRRVAAGAYEYELFRGGSADPNDWFLRSHLIDTPADPTTPSGPDIPLYRPEVPPYAPIPAIARQMQKLLAADTIYETVTRPEINGKLADNGLESDDVPKSTLLPDGIKWLDEDEVKTALGKVNGSSAGTTTGGVHGLGLLGVRIGETELTSEAPNTVVTEGTPEVEVEVQNQGESTENGITVVVTANGKETTQEIPTLEAGASGTAVVPLTPAPEGETTLEVEAEPVPGEQVTENNEATYTVNFE